MCYARLWTDSFVCASQAAIGRNQGFLTEANYQQLYQATEKQSRMLSGWRNSLASA